MERPMELAQKHFDRFWSKVNKESGHIPKHDPSLGECWEWAGHVGARGYGRWSVNQIGWTAHRYGFWIQTGEDPRDYPDLFVLHKCNNKVCVRRDHLYQGDYGDNACDDAEHRLGFKREKMSFERAEEIRALYATGEYSQSTLGFKYGIGGCTVNKIVRNKSWRKAV